MKTRFKDKRIIVSGENYEQVLFDIGTDKYCTQFDGRGGITYFHYVNNPRYNVKGHSYLNIYIDGEPLTIFGKKKVICCGRIQKIVYQLKDGSITLTQYGYESYVFNRISYRFKEEKEIVMAYDYCEFKDVPSLASTFPVDEVMDNYSYYITSKGKTARFDVCFSFTDDPKKMVKKSGRILKMLENEIESISLPESADTELKKAIYASSVFAALENYKSIPGFSGLTAGVNYLVPFRTYYRDSYWTVLALHKEHPEIIRNQVLTLAKGIGENGECPSAVKSDYSSFWGGHYDSPSFFVMETFDYVAHSGDKSLLKEVVNGKTVLELCEKVLENTASRTDETHLIYKKGPYNRLDWSDEVNRIGYVTFDECLYYRALSCMGSLIGGENKYKKEAEIVKKKINEILWNDELGYYYNYKDGDVYEDNLVVDTILAVLFDIVPEDKKDRFLDNFEKMLYSKNHEELKDYGVMSAYPVYKRYKGVVNKSTQSYRYHNGANWPYWSAIVAYAMSLNGREYEYALTSWFMYNIKRGNLTPIEYFSPYYQDGSNLQAWSATSAFCLDWLSKPFFVL
ncbi:MAG: hypothetical protein MJ239_01650 [Bacilli bacterium]|nr:hypothetical protein [Bacilli bacterium]